jgi:hypothetical protein
MEAAEASAPPSGYPAELTGSAAGEDQEPASSYPETGAEPGSPSYPETDAEPGSPTEARPVLAGHALNGSSVEEARISYTADFYYEPLSASLRRYIRAVSYPADETEAAVSYGDLRYVHVLHYDFEGKVAEGELICHEKIAQDLAEIFYELYRNEYRIEKIRLIDEYDGDDRASMEDNNTSCFNHRTVENSSNLSRHAYGLAVDVNPFYNPYVVYQTDGNARISPASAAAYADRSGSFPYKIDESDLCYRLFTEHGFTWGGSWNSSKDYQHFQKAP